MIQTAIKYAWKFVGVPYEWGGDNSQGLDCSGFVGVILRGVGIMGNREDLTAQGMFNAFSHTETKVAKAGNICFYGKSINEISHVAFMVDDEHILEAGGGGSRTLSETDADRDNAFVRLRPYDYRKIVAMVHPLS